MLKQDHAPYRQVATVRGVGPNGSLTYTATDIFTGDTLYSSWGTGWHRSSESPAQLTQQFLSAWEKTEHACVAVGGEDIDGAPTDVIKLHVDNAGREVVDSTFWISRDSSLPLKRESTTITIYPTGPVAFATTAMYDYRNVQPPSEEADELPLTPSLQAMVKQPDSVRIEGWPMLGQTTADEVRQKMGATYSENHLDPFHRGEYVWTYVRDGGSQISTFLFDKNDHVVRVLIYKH